MNGDSIGDITTTRCQDSQGFYWLALVRVGPKSLNGSVVLQARFGSEEDGVMDAVLLEIPLSIKGAARWGM